MTWNASAKATATYQRLIEACDEFKFDLAKTFIVGKRVYTFEPDYMTHADGSITGDIFTVDQVQNVKRIEPFRIDANGKVTQNAPLKKFAQKMVNL